MEMAEKDRVIQKIVALLERQHCSCEAMLRSAESVAMLLEVIKSSATIASGVEQAFDALDRGLAEADAILGRAATEAETFMGEIH